MGYFNSKQNSKYFTILSFTDIDVSSFEPELEKEGRIYRVTHRI